MAKKKIPTFREHLEASKAVCAECPPIVVLEGEEEHLRGETLRALLHSLQTTHPQADVVQYQGTDTSGEMRITIASLLDELTSPSLFAADKIVVLRQADALLFGKSAEETGTRTPPSHRLAEWVAAPNPGMWLVVELKTLPRNRILGKALAKTAVVPCPPLTRQADTVSWLQGVARQEGKTLAPGVAELLHTAHGNRLADLAGEMAKLVLYVGERETIEPDDVKEFLSGTVEYNAFGLTNAIEKRDLKQALHYARLVAGVGSRDATGKRIDAVGSVHRALAMIANVMEQIIQYRAHVGSGRSPRDIAAEVGGSPFRAEPLLEAAERFPAPVLRHALDTLAGEIHATHDTGGDPFLSLERVCLACCRPLHPV